MPSSDEIRTYVDAPLAFIESLTIPGARGAVRFGDAMATFQRERFTSIAPALLAVANGTQPPIGKHLWEATKGASKDSDLACCLLWLLAFTRRPLLCQVGAADSDQADELRKAAKDVLRLNPWLGQRIKIQATEIIGTATDSVVEIIAADVAGSHGARPDVLILNELSHVTKLEFAQNLMDNAAKVPFGLTVIATNAGYRETWQFAWRELARTSDRWRFHQWAQPAPWLDAADVEEARLRNPPSRFNRLFWGVWPHGTGDNMPEHDITAAIADLLDIFAEPDFGLWRFVAAADIGLKRDWSAFVVVGWHIVTKRIRVCEVLEWQPPLGGVLELEPIEQAIFNLVQMYPVDCVLFDPWQCIGTAQTLARKGIEMIEMPATPKNLTIMATALVELLRDRRLEIPNREQSLIADLRKASLVEKSNNNLRIISPRDATGHGDRLSALLMTLPMAADLAANYEELPDFRMPEVPIEYR